MKYALHQVQQVIHDTALEKGWWDEDKVLSCADTAMAEAIGPHIRAAKMMLIVSEIAEALEGERLKHGGKSDKIPGYSIQEEELADAIIRILDLGARYDWDIPGAVLAKMEYNAGRPHRHGGKRL